MAGAEQSQNRDTEKWVDALSRFSDKPGMFCEDRGGTIIHIRAVQGHDHGAELNPIFLIERDAVELERTHVPHGSSSNF